MNVLLHKEIFNGSVSQADVSYLIQTIIRKKHSILLDADDMEDITWLNDSDRMIIEDSFAAGSIGDPVAPDCEVIHNAANIHHAKQFDVAEAIRYVDTPLEIILENGTNDSPFVLAIIKFHLPYRDNIQDAYSEERIVFGTGGGCTNIENYLRGKLHQRGGRTKFLRYFVIVDGDKRFPEQEIKKYDNLIAFLRSINVEFHILEKRCMENYLPIESYPKSSENQRWLNSFKSLNNHQRDFFNISGGFRGDVPDSKKKLISADGSNIRSLLPPEQQNFYSDVLDTNFSILSDGYPLPSFKSSFPKGYEYSTTNRVTFDSIVSHQSNPDELKDIASTIHRLL